MTYGHSPRAPAENAVARALARYKAWRQLDAEKRFELIEQALGSPANDLDSFPVAL
jgi:hypothetical protein